MNYIPLILVLIFIISDLITKRRSSKVITYITIISINILLLFPAVFLTTENLIGFVNIPLIETWIILTGYLSMRFALDKHSYLPHDDTETLLKYALIYNITTLATIIINVFLFLIIAGVIAGFLLIFLILLLPLAIIFGFFSTLAALITILDNFLIIIIILFSLIFAVVFLVIAPCITGMRAVKKSTDNLNLSQRNKILYHIFMWFPYLNTITMFILRNKIKRNAPTSYEIEKNTD